MKYDLILKRNVEAECWHVQGAIARAERRDELYPFLLYVREEGSADAREIAEHLLFEKRARIPVAERMLDNMRVLRLLEVSTDQSDRRNKRYALTDEGREAIEKELVFVPRYGAWTLWISRDPLLPNPVLRMEEWKEPPAHHEVYEKSSSDRSFTEIPSWLNRIRGEKLRPVAGSGETLLFDEIKEKGECVKGAKIQLRLLWNVTQSELRLTGEIKENKVDSVLDAPQLSEERAWRMLLEQEKIPGQRKSQMTGELWLDEEESLLTRWDNDKEELQMAFDEIEEDEREPMERTLKFDSPDLGEHGKFNKFSMPGVALAALDAESATKWAHWRLEHRISDYATAQRFDRWCDEAALPFEAFAPTLPTRAELADSVGNNLRYQHLSPSAWRLIAAEDWGL